MVLELGWFAVDLVAGRCDVVAPRPPRDAAPPREARPPLDVRPPRYAELHDVPPPEPPCESELPPVPEGFPPSREAGLTPQAKQFVNDQQADARKALSWQD